MSERKIILEAMKKAGEPLSAGKVAELTGLDRKIVDKVFSEMKKDGSSMEFVLSGRLDTTTAPELEAQVKGNLENIEKLCFDFKDLEYISSAGLRVLLGAQKIMSKQGSMVVKNCSEEVKYVFDVTGFTDILTIE